MCHMSLTELQSIARPAISSVPHPLPLFVWTAMMVFISPVIPCTGEGRGGTERRKGGNNKSNTVVGSITDMIDHNVELLNDVAGRNSVTAVKGIMDEDTATAFSGAC